MKEKMYESYPNNRQENWVGYRETESFKSGLEGLENIPGINNTHKMLILAVALNLKKATEFSIPPDLVEAHDIEKILSDLGIYFYRDTDANKRIDKRLQESGHDEKDRFMYYKIASTPDDLSEAIENAFIINRDGHKAFGDSMEFPDTAIAAFQQYVKKGDTQALLPLDDVQLTEEERAFSFFRFSSENWEKEIQWLEQIIAGVKEYSPVLYNRIISDYRNSSKRRDD